MREPIFSTCENHNGSKPYQGYSSFIYSVKWSDFILNPGNYIDIADEIRKNISAYELTKLVK